MIPSETLERFILDVAAQLPGADIFEAHFFTPRRVGGVESGVAVVAARLPVVEPEAEPVLEPDAGVDVAPEDESVGAEAETPVDAEVDVPEEADAEMPDEAAADESPYAPEVEDAPAPELPQRYTVFSATYRHTLKGPERGRWEVTVKAEADAPLVTVDAVVRGVQRRAEDAEEVDRMTGDEIRAVVDARQARTEGAAEPVRVS